MSTLTLKKNAEIAFSAITITGDILYDESREMLFLSDNEGPAENLTTGLSEYGVSPLHGHVFIKDWSEHSGLTASLVEAGVVEIVNEVFIGPFNSRAHQVRVLIPATEGATK